MADAIRTAPREDRVLCGPAITFAIAEEINLLKQVLQHRAGFDVDLFGMLNIRTTEHGTVEVTEKRPLEENSVCCRSWAIDQLEDAVQYFVDRRMELKLGLEYESGVES